MTFNKCSIGGRCYGDVIDEKTGEVVELSEVSKVSSVLWSNAFNNISFYIL